MPAFAGIFAFICAQGKIHCSAKNKNKTMDNELKSFKKFYNQNPDIKATTEVESSSIPKKLSDDIDRDKNLNSRDKKRLTKNYDYVFKHLYASIALLSDEFTLKK